MMVWWWQHQFFSDCKSWGSLFLWACSSAHGRRSPKTQSMCLPSSWGACFASLAGLSESSPMLSSDRICCPSCKSLRYFLCREKGWGAIPPLLQEPASWTPKGRAEGACEWVPISPGSVATGVLCSHTIPHSAFSNLFTVLAGFSSAVCAQSSSNNSMKRVFASFLSFLDDVCLEFCSATSVLQ